MFGLGPTELIVILLVALVIFGRSRLPKVGESIGQALRAFRESADKVAEEIKRPPEEKPEAVTAKKEAPLLPDDGPRRCPSCGDSVEAGKVFCGSCGTRVDDTPKAPSGETSTGGAE